MLRRWPATSLTGDDGRRWLEAQARGRGIAAEGHRHVRTADIARVGPVPEVSKLSRFPS
ncbi:hypothetical protein ACFWN2_27965 [Lentzea sp. NPDC058436]|uniref:hypothetical protein n=1 Tax=Lentzea sp. NPDC058436 TaxID=3346499 RepID=UPI0036636463